MDKKDLRKIMLAIVASGFCNEYSNQGLYERAKSVVDLIEQEEEKDEES